jgi:hypothetical protein
MPLRRRGITALLYVGMVTLVAMGFSTRTLALSQNRVANEIAINGISSFFEALRTSEIDYHHYYQSLPSQQALQVLAAALQTPDSSFVALDSGRLTRARPAQQDGLGRLKWFWEDPSAELSLVPNTQHTPFDALRRDVVSTTTIGHSPRAALRPTTSFHPFPASRFCIARQPHRHLGQHHGRTGYHSFCTAYGYFDNMNYYGSNDLRWWILADRRCKVR